MEVTAAPSPVTITSVPALAAAMRTLVYAPVVQPLHALLNHDPLVPMYEVTGDSQHAEAVALVRALEEIGERLRRLHAAYGEWKEFDTGAYFDLSPAQTQRLVRVSERVSAVHVTFFVDLLLPSFRHAEQYWHDRFCPAYWQMMDGLRAAEEPSRQVNTFTRQVQPQMIQRWASLCAVVQRARTLMEQDSAYLVAYISEEERARWRHAWHQDPTIGLNQRLQPDLPSVPTLTLSTEFPLPTRRQPGRLRRLRTNRSRGRPSRHLHWQALDG